MIKMSYFTSQLFLESGANCSFRAVRVLYSADNSRNFSRFELSETKADKACCAFWHLASTSLYSYANCTEFSSNSLSPCLTFCLGLRLILAICPTNDVYPIWRSIATATTGQVIDCSDGISKICHEGKSYRQAQWPAS